MTLTKRHGIPLLFLPFLGYTNRDDNRCLLSGPLHLYGSLYTAGRTYTYKHSLKTGIAVDTLDISFRRYVWLCQL